MPLGFPDPQLEVLTYWTLTRVLSKASTSPFPQYSVLGHIMTFVFPHSAPFSFPSCSRKPELFGPVVSRIALGVSLYVHYIAFFLVPYEFALLSASC